MKKIWRAVLIGATSLSLAVGGMMLPAPSEATWGYQETFSHRETCLTAKSFMEKHQEAQGWPTITVKNCVPNGKGGFDVFLVRA